MLFNEKIQLNNLKLPPKAHNPKTYHRLYRIIKSHEYIKLLEVKNKDLFEMIVERNRIYTPEHIKYLILDEYFK